MDKIESLQALKAGKRIRKKEWSEGCFIYLKDDRVFYHDGTSRDNSPLGPLTVITLSFKLTVTPEGIVMIFLPIRDISNSS